MKLKISKLTPDIIDALISEKYKKFYEEWLNNNEEQYLNDSKLLMSVIKNQNTPLEILLKIYEVKNYSDLEVMISLKINKIEDSDLLEELFLKYENDFFIVEAISKNTFISDKTVKKIYSDYKKLIPNLIFNDKIDFEEVLKINDNFLYGLKDEAYKYLEDYVSSIKNPEELEKLMNYTSSDLNYIISQSRYLNFDLFKILSLSNDFRTRSVIASRADTPLEILEYFIDDDSDSVRLSLIRNENITKKILLSLAEKENKVTLLKEIINHKNTDIEILNVIAQRNVLSEAKREALLRLENLKNLNIDTNSDYEEIIALLLQAKVDEIQLLPQEEKTRKVVKVKIE